jgi:SRSO17 transposase
LETAHQYIKGLFCLEKGKANMERMEEEIPDSEYRAYQHFLTNSKWDHQEVLAKVSADTSELMRSNKKKSQKPIGCIIDESSHLKKGKKSVGVSSQYAGVVGKVENCQVGVYASLVNDIRAGLVGERLFLPEVWVNDKERCQEAGVPESHRKYKTKPQLALEIIDELISQGVEFDWIGGDGLYGHNREFREGLDKRNLFYVLNVHKDEKVFLSCPEFSVPEKSGRRGRPPKNVKPSIDPIRLDKYLKQIDSEGWSIEKKIRKTHKGWLKLKVHKTKVWLWEDQEGAVQERTLIITQTMDGKKETKYSISNGGLNEYTHHEYAYFVAQRYWVERTFDDSKNELGMSDYQVRKWLGWHHHHALVFMAGLFLLKRKLEFEESAPLMSMRDARILMIVSMFGTKKEIKNRLKQMETRHINRQYDIDRRYKT